MLEKKKIYFLINSLEQWWAERVVVNLSRELANAFDITIFTLKDSIFYDVQDTVRIVSLSQIRNNILMFLFVPLYILRFKRELKKTEFANGVSFLEIANFVHILAKKNAIISFRINISFFVWIVGLAYKSLIRLLYPRAGRIIVNSEENRFDLAGYLQVSSDRINTIYNPIDTERVAVLKREAVTEINTDLLAGKKVFLDAGRLVWQKRHEIVIKAFKKIYDEIDQDFIYLILSDWPLRQELAMLVNNLWLDENIFFLWQQKNVFKFMNISDYYVTASVVEWFPNLLIEAMVCDLPIITADFKSWAKEVILGEYNKDLKIMKYPYYGPNWVLLDSSKFIEDFYEVYVGGLKKIEQRGEGLEKFETPVVSDRWLNLLTS